MRAAFVSELGAADSIQIGEIGLPVAGDNAVLVQVQAAAVNHVDTYVRSGAFEARVPLPFIVGRDLVGTVVSDGLGFAAGQQVWCNSLGFDGRQGACAEFAAVPAERLYELPSSVDPLIALPTLHPGATAWLALCRDIHIAEKDTVLVNGSGGAVGSAAVQIASALGACVIAMNRTADAEWASICGATSAMQYTTELFGTEKVPARRGLDVFLDTTGHVDIEQVLPLMAPGGQIMLLAGMTNKATFTIGELYTRDVTLRGMAISNAGVDDLAQAAGALNRLLLQGALRSREVVTFKLDDTAEAHHAQEVRKYPDARLVVSIR